ncbi:hypothetical protein A0257_00295 [Hymenobacter psoromatis]|nr:hypothetical protein A0257_00295 [Hymenobacter psoromatis]
MKPWIIRIAAGALALASISFSSCKKDEVRTILTPSNSPTLTASATTVTLTQANAANTAITFTWTPVKSLSISDNTATLPAITYYLQFAKKGSNFTTPVSIVAGSASTTGASTTTVTVSDLNTALINLGLTPGTATDVEVRLNASYASNSTSFSNVVPLAATTYVYCAQPAKSWSLIGDAISGWSTDVVMTYDCASKTYSYKGPIKALAGTSPAGYKFRFNSDWTANLGGAVPTGGALTQDGGNLSVAADGTYTILLTPGSFDATGKSTGGTFTIK